MFEIGDRVFAKLRYYPHWPGIVDNVIRNNTGKAIKYLVKCYGSNDYITVKPSDICSYEENKSLYGQQKADNFRNKKINAALMEAEESLTQQIDACSKVNEISKLIIDNHDGIEDLDLETSLTLAAEAGNALLSENTKLKQDVEKLRAENLKLQTELHNTWKDTQTYQEIEEKLKEKENIITTLIERNNELLRELNHNSKQAEQERILKEEFIQQSELENQHLIGEINKLQNKLIDQSNLAKQTEINTRVKLNSLLEDGEKLKEQIIEKNATIMAMQKSSEELIFKLTDLEKITRSHLSSFLKNITSYSNIATTYMNNKEHTQPAPYITQTMDNYNRATVSLQEELHNAQRDRQTCNKNWERIQ